MWFTHSSLWNDMAIALGTQPYQMTAYHPQSNGLIERLHRGLKASLYARLDSRNVGHSL